MFSYECFFGIQAEEQSQNDQAFEQEESNKQQTLFISLISQENDIVQSQVYTKCEYCFKEFQIDQYEDHLKQCQQQYIKIMMKIQKGHEVFFSQKQQVRYRHYPPLPQKRISCLYCSQYFVISTIFQHQEQCRIQQYQIRKENFLLNVESSQYFSGRCIWCTLKILESQQKNHEFFCKTKDKIYRQLISFQPALTQFQAIWRIYERSAFENLYFQENITDLMKKYGYSREDLETMSNFIENQSPINIHFNLSKHIQQFLEDSQYKNVFETYQSSEIGYIQKRKKWETYLFGHYYDQCLPNQRVKYGFLNYSNDRYGSKKCLQYGTSILVLNENVRKRCTISHNRQYSDKEIVATLKYSYVILLRFNQKQLKALYLASRGFEIDSRQLESIKEVHIHGSIKFFRDVKYICTSKQERDKNLHHVKLFEKKFDLKILTYEELGAEQLL